MSATLNAELFVNYFYERIYGVALITIPGMISLIKIFYHD